MLHDSQTVSVEAQVESNPCSDTGYDDTTWLGSACLYSYVSGYVEASDCMRRTNMMRRFAVCMHVMYDV